jgi:hypothetical protein
MKPKQRALVLAVATALLLVATASRALIITSNDGTVGSFTIDAGAVSSEAGVFPSVSQTQQVVFADAGISLAPEFPPLPATAALTSPLLAPASSADSPTGPLTLGSPAYMLPAPNIVSVVWGPPSSLDPPHAQWATDLTGMYLGLLSSVDFMGPFLEYTGPPPNGGPIYAFIPEVQGPFYITPANTNTNISGSDIAVELTHQVAIGALPSTSSTANGQLIYLLFLPPSIRSGNSCWGWFGSHGYVSNLSAAFTLVPFCNGNYPDGSPAVVSVESGTEWAAAHELMEAMTDPLLGPGGWWVRSGPLAGNEIADLCNVSGAPAASLAVFANEPPFTLPLFFSNKAYNAGTAQQVTGVPGCVFYPSACDVCWPCAAGCITSSNDPTCNANCSCVAGCIANLPPTCFAHCTAQQTCQTIADACGNPYACPCPPPPPTIRAAVHFNVGDPYSFTINGASANVPAQSQRTLDGIAKGTIALGETDANGNLTFTSSWTFTAADQGAWADSIVVGTTPATPNPWVYTVGTTAVPALGAGRSRGGYLALLGLVLAGAATCLVRPRRGRRTG